MFVLKPLLCCHIVLACAYKILLRQTNLQCIKNVMDYLKYKVVDTGNVKMSQKY